MSVVIKPLALVASHATMQISQGIIFNKDILQCIKSIQDNWSYAYLSQKGIKSFINEIYIKINHINELFNEHSIYLNHTLDDSDIKGIAYLGDDKIRYEITTKLQDLQKYINKYLLEIKNFNLPTFKQNKSKYEIHKELLNISHDYMIAKKDKDINIYYAIKFHILSIDVIIHIINNKSSSDNSQIITNSIIKYDDLTNILNAKKDGPEIILNSMKQGYNILTDIIRSYQNIDYLINEYNNEIIFEINHNIINIKFDYENIFYLSFNTLVDYFNKHSTKIKAQAVIYHSYVRNIDKEKIIFSSNEQFILRKETTLRYLLNMEYKDYTSKYDEDEKIHTLTMYNKNFLQERANIKPKRLNNVIQRFNIFKEKYNF